MDAGTATVVIDPGSNPSGFFADLLRAIMGGNWSIVAALGLVLVVWLVRGFGGKFWPELNSKRGGAILVLVTSFVGAFATALAANTGWSWALLLRALETGFTAAGGWVVIRRILGIVSDTSTTAAPVVLLGSPKNEDD